MIFFIRKYCLLIIVICVYSASSGQGAEYSSVGNASVALKGIWSTHNNQAGLANLTKTSFSIDYQNLYSLKELNLVSLAIAIPLKENVFALSYSEFGYELYKERELGISYARKLLPKLYAGVRISVQSLSISEYGRSRVAVVEGGIQYFTNKKTIIATHIYNPNRSVYLGDLSKSIPVRFRSGVTHYFSNKVMMCVEMEKETSRRPDLKMGLEYKYFDRISFRGGFSLREVKNYFGIGIHFKKLVLDISSSNHPVLGFSPQCSLSYEF